MEIGATISKWSFDFEMELRFQLKDFSRDLLDRKKARDFSNVFLHLSILRLGNEGQLVARGKGVFIKYLQHVLLEKEMDQSSSIFFSCVDWLFLTNGFLPKLYLIVMVAS